MMDDLVFKIFKLTSTGFCCTQIMLKLALDEEGTENPDLIRSVHGLCKGIGGSQKSCGVLTGGIAILGLYAAKGTDREYPKEDYSKMMDEFIEWFETEFNSTECADLIGITQFDDVANNQSYPIKCGDILVKSYQMIQQILTEHDYEFGSRE